MNIKDFTYDELKDELLRREKAKGAVSLASTDYKKRMNFAIKQKHSKVVEDEIKTVMMLNPKYENNIQKALVWGIKTKSKALIEDAIKTYKDFSAERYFHFVPFGIELEEILFMLDIDAEVTKRYLNFVFAYWVENEIKLLRMKRQGGIECLYHEWCGIDTGYDKEIHKINRKKINDVLERAKESYPYCRIFRKSILIMLRYAESYRFNAGQERDFLETHRFLRWSGVRWGNCTQTNVKLEHEK